MRADSLRAVATNEPADCTVRWKVKTLLTPYLAMASREGKLVGDLAGADGVAVHEHFAATQEFVGHHAGSDDGDDDLVVADDAAPGGFGEGEPVRLRAVDCRLVHREDELGVAFLVAAGAGCSGAAWR